MNMGFWAKLKADKQDRPIMTLAPMADVTDAAFRRIITKYGKPDVTWTEFVSADGLMSPGRKALQIDLSYIEAERPIVAQLFSSNLEKMRGAAALCHELGFDGIDINMGCPDKTIEKQGCGAAMIKDPSHARAIIRAAKEGAPNLPISVKTRIGYNRNELDTWLPELLAEEPAAVTIHARTRKEMSKVPARWEHIREAVEIRNKLGSKTLILGNGDVESLADAVDKAESTGADGVMLGRAIFGNPWLFSGKTKHEIPITMRLRTMVEHTKLFDDLLGKYKSMAIMKKHYKAYVEGFDGAKELRAMLMEAKTVGEIEKLTESFIAQLSKTR